MKLFYSLVIAWCCFMLVASIFLIYDIEKIISTYFRFKDWICELSENFKKQFLHRKAILLWKRFKASDNFSDNDLYFDKYRDITNNLSREELREFALDMAKKRTQLYNKHN